MVSDARFGTTNNYAIAPLTSDPGSVTNPAVGSTNLSGTLAAVDASGRPVFPSLFITDVTTTSASTAGDWQSGGTAYPPHAVFGTWKGAVTIVDQTHSPVAGQRESGHADPAKNDWNLAGGGSSVPTSGGKTPQDEGYGAEIRWNVAQLSALLPGHSYRFYFMVPDGDQNQNGGDCGQGCVYIFNINSNTVSIITVTNIAACPGSSATFSTEVSGIGPSPPLSVEFDGTALARQTNGSLTIDPVAATNAGTYQVVVTGAVNSVTNIATLTVSTNTTATALTPISGGACPGGSVTYSTVASGTGPFTYQWSMNGTALTGQTTNSFTIPSVSSSDAGTYSVLVGGACNNVTNSTVLVVNTPTTATALPPTVTANPGSSATLTTTASGTGPFNLRPVDLQRRAHQRPDEQQPDDQPGGTDQRGQLPRGGYRRLQQKVTNCTTFNVNTPTTATILGFSSLVLCPGNNGSLSTTASGTGPFSYQWSKNGSAISGQTASDITIALGQFD